MPHNRGTRHKPKWVGHVSYHGHKKWVGTHTSLDVYKGAELRCLVELRNEVDRPLPRHAVTVLQFADATIHENGRITMMWPEHERTQKETGRRPSSVRRLREGLRPFVREFAERHLDSFDRDEALTWALARGPNNQQAVRQFFNNALDRDLIEHNHFAPRREQAQTPHRPARLPDNYRRAIPTPASMRVPAAPMTTGASSRERSSRSARPQSAPASCSRSTTPTLTWPRTSSMSASS